MDEKTIKRAKIPAEISAADLPAINAVLAKEERVELIPVKGGVKVVRVRREEVKYSPKMREKKQILPTWIRTKRGLEADLIEWECSKCGFIPSDSLLHRKCDGCGSIMYLGEPE